jgi:antitoxin (DNA-binding transcriptional repressor) of toxin-antitoxin stability system
MRDMNASDFKARCLALIDEIARTGEGLTILKRGRPLVRVIPFVEDAGRSAQDRLGGSVEILGDVVGPALPPDAWDAEAGR